jgi:Lactate dehydrogenase and related dehydrogenases
MPFLLLESLHPEAEHLLAQHDQVIKSAYIEDAVSIVRRTEISAIFTRGKQKISCELMQACGPALRAVCRAGTGLDTIDLVAAKALGITVIFAPGLNAQTTAEHTLMLLLMAARRAATLNAHVKANRWSVRDTYMGIELNGKTLGIIGLGSIGRRVAEFGDALGMKVIYWSRNSRDDRWAYRSLDNLLSEADAISLHIALTEETRHLIGAREFALMKPGVILVNTARGALIDQAALCKAIDSGQVGAFAADVLEHQPPDLRKDECLLDSEHVTLTPHVAGLTDRTYREVCLFCAHNVLAVVKGELPDPRSVFC